jgi:hypothetical protein
VSAILDKFNIPEVAPLPEELEHYLEIPFDSIHEIMSDELHMRMAAVVHQRGYLENLVANAKIEVRQLEREFIKKWHDNYTGHNKKMNAEAAQLESGIWEELDIARGILDRVTAEYNRLEDLYKFYSRVLSSRQGGL